MFYALAIGSMLGYAIQSTLLVRYARKIDGLSMSFYRNISFLVTLLPLLFFSTPQGVMASLHEWPLWIVSCLAGVVSLAIGFAAFHYIAVGISSSIGKAAEVIFLIGLSWIVVHETISTAALLLIAIIIATAVWLGFQKNPMDHLTNKTLKGIGLVILSVAFKCVSSFIFLIISRRTDPLASSYIWESGIAVATVGVLLLRSIFFKVHLQKISLRNFGAIALCASPTLIGTGLLALATRLGPIGVASAISCASLIVTSLLAWRWYRERLRAKQWIGILVIAVGVALLKFT